MLLSYTAGRLAQVNGQAFLSFFIFIYIYLFVGHYKKCYFTLKVIIGRVWIQLFCVCVCVFVFLFFFFFLHITRFAEKEDKGTVAVLLRLLFIEQ